MKNLESFPNFAFHNELLIEFFKLNNISHKEAFWHMFSAVACILAEREETECSDLLDQLKDLISHCRETAKTASTAQNHRLAAERKAED
jgi:hypothetical protein